MAPVGPHRPPAPRPPRRVGLRVLQGLGGLVVSRRLGLGVGVGLWVSRRTLPPAPLPRVPSGGGGRRGPVRHPTPQPWRPTLQGWGVGPRAARPSRRLGCCRLTRPAPVAGGGSRAPPPRPSRAAAPRVESEPPWSGAFGGGRGTQQERHTAAPGQQYSVPPPSGGGSGVLRPGAMPRVPFLLGVPPSARMPRAQADGSPRDC